MNPKSYARIYMRREKVGLRLVCEKKYNFILYSHALLSMVNYPASYRRVKYRNAILKEAIGYPAGEVWAVLEKHADSHAKITVCIGPKNEDIEVDERTKKPINLLKEYVFFLPLADFKKFIDVLKLMKKQKHFFFEALEVADTEVGIPSVGVWK